MGLFRKLVLTVAASMLSVGVLGALTPASAVDSSWGCSGFCRSAPTQP